MTPAGHESPSAEDRRLYESLCLKYQDGEHVAIQEFDRAILTLSAGSLGLSLAFIKDIVPLNQAVHVLFLFTSWYCFGAAILLTLVSFFASQKAFKRYQEIAYDYYMEGRSEAIHRRNVAALATRYLTYAEGLFFLTAFVMTLIFTTVNVNNLSAILKTTRIEPGLRMNENPLPRRTARAQDGVEPAGLIRVPVPKLAMPPKQDQQSSPPPATGKK
jgi:hypothetical protein